MNKVRSWGCSTVGLDVDPVVKNNKFLDRAVPFDGGKFPLEDNSFDVVFSHWVMEHVPDPALHFKEVHRVLAPGGVYLFRTPNLFHYSMMAAKYFPEKLRVPVARWLKREREEAHDPYLAFYRANTSGQILRLLQESGLMVDELKILEGWPIYGKGSRLLFLLFMSYERMVNLSPAFEKLRHTIDCVARKPKV